MRGRDGTNPNDNGKNDTKGKGKTGKKGNGKGKTDKKNNGKGKTDKKAKNNGKGAAMKKPSTGGKNTKTATAASNRKPVQGWSMQKRLKMYPTGCIKCRNIPGCTPSCYKVRGESA